MPEAKPRRKILNRFGKDVSETRVALVGASDAHLLDQWTPLIRGKPILAQPRISVVRNFMLNQTVHHRAQLDVYFRLSEIPVPALSDPSADESTM